MMGKIALTIALILVFGLLSSVTAPTPKGKTPGVLGGDYFTYKMYGIYTHRNEGELAIPTFERNNTEWTKITIIAISGSVIHQTYTLRMLDGREVTFDFKTDVNPNNQGMFRIADKGVPICAADLEPGDRIPTAELTLDETIIRDGRQVNHAFWNVSDDWGDIYFDRQTGVLIEIHRTHTFINSAKNDLVEKTDVVCLIDTNRWQLKA